MEKIICLPLVWIGLLIELYLSTHWSLLPNQCPGLQQRPCHPELQTGREPVEGPKIVFGLKSFLSRWVSGQSLTSEKVLVWEGIWCFEREASFVDAYELCASSIWLCSWLTVMETLTWEALLGASLLLCGEKQLPFSSSNPTLKKKEKMPLPETEIHSEMVGVEATSFCLDLTVNWASCFTWNNDFNAAVRSH